MATSEMEIRLRKGDVIEHPIANLRGRAKKWSSSYWRTWQSVQQRLEAEGYRIGVIAGPKGGITTKQTMFYLYLPSGNDFKVYGRGEA